MRLHAPKTDKRVGRGGIESGVVVVRLEPFPVIPRPRSHRRRRRVRHQKVAATFAL